MFRRIREMYKGQIIKRYKTNKNGKVVKIATLKL